MTVLMIDDDQLMEKGVIDEGSWLSGLTSDEKE